MYSLEFSKQAQKQFLKLDSSQRFHVAKALERRLLNPHITGAQLRGELSGFYKIKLRAIGLRVIYQVVDDRLVVLVLAIGRRENDAVYQALKNT
jgi:mRNA interferase RelE/StbE